MVEELKVTRDENVVNELNKMYNQSEDSITANAVLSRVYADRISTDTINQKVNAQMNAITAGILGINPKFKENSKNYDTVKQSIVETMSNYESALIEYSKFYDTKIEQLILRKVELESSFVGILINDEYLYRKEQERISQKENDKVKNKVTEGIKKVFEKLKIKKSKAEIDPRLIATMQDSQELEAELASKMDAKLEQTKTESKDNKINLEKVEKELRLINEEISRLNKLKKDALFNAMEVGEKSIDINVKRPHIFKKITRFFASRFNTPKIVEQTIIEPLNKRIESFRENELLSIKGE